MIFAGGALEYAALGVGAMRRPAWRKDAHPRVRPPSEGSGLSSGIISLQIIQWDHLIVGGSPRFIKNPPIGQDFIPLNFILHGNQGVRLQRSWGSLGVT